LLPSRVVGPLLLVTIFAQGYLSMGFQLVASRLLAPVFGTTLTVWASIISTFLAAFALGALIGGLTSRMAARRVRTTILVVGMVGTAGFVFTARFGHAVVEALDAWAANMALSLASSCLILFLIPVAAMSSVLPITTEALIIGGRPGGLSSGLIYAVSTFGNIGGVLFTAFFMIPYFPTSVILVFWCISAMLCFAILYALLANVPFDSAPRRERSGAV
jgi:hypothetical protein